MWSFTTILFAIHIVAAYLHERWRDAKGGPKKYQANTTGFVMDSVALSGFVIAIAGWHIPPYLVSSLFSSYVMLSVHYNLVRNTWLANDPYDGEWHKAQAVEGFTLMIALCLIPGAWFSVLLAAPVLVNTYNGFLNIFYRYDAGMGTVFQKRRWFRVGEHSASSDKFFLRFSNPELSMAITYIGGSAVWIAAIILIKKS